MLGQDLFVRVGVDQLESVHGDARASVVLDHEQERAGVDVGRHQAGALAGDDLGHVLDSGSSADDGDETVAADLSVTHDRAFGVPVGDRRATPEIGFNGCHGFSCPLNGGSRARLARQDAR